VKRSSRFSKLPKGAWALCSASLFNDISSEAIYPLLPLFLITVVGGTPAQLGMIEGAAEAAAGFFKFAFGRISDRMGRTKPFVFLGYFLSNCTKPLLGLSHHWGQVLGLRVTDRLGKGLRTAARDAWLGRMVTREQSTDVFALNRAMDHLGAIIGPLSAAAFLYFRPNDLRTLFVLTAIPGFFVVLATLIPKEATVKLPPAPRFKFKQFPKPLRTYFIIFLIFSIANSSDTFILLRLREAHIEGFWIPGLWAMLHGVKMSSTLYCPKIVDALGIRKSILIGWGCFIAFYGSFGLIDDPIVLTILLLIYGIYFGFTEAPEKSLIRKLTASKDLGSAYGGYAMIAAIAAFPSSVLFGTIWSEWGVRAAFLSSAAVAALAAGLLLRHAECDA
jgi:MFS family permease